MQPLVSVVVTTYNQAPYISPALESVFAQNYQSYEVIVVDDGSTDETPEQIAKFEDRVLAIRQPNRGVAASRNSGVERARGEFVAFLDGDDLWSPGKLSAQVSAALNHPESGLIVVDGVQFDEQKILLDSLIGPVLEEFPGRRGSFTTNCYEWLLRRNLIASVSQILTPRRVLQQVGKSDVRFTVSSDWDLYLRIAMRHSVTFVDSCLMSWRYLASSVSGPMHLRTLRWAEDAVEVLKKHLRTAPTQTRPLIRRLLQEKTLRSAETAYYYGAKHDRRYARQYLLRLWRRRPLSPVVGAFLCALYCPEPVTRCLAPLVRSVAGWR